MTFTTNIKSGKEMMWIPQSKITEKKAWDDSKRYSRENAVSKRMTWEIVKKIVKE